MSQISMIIFFYPRNLMQRMDLFVSLCRTVKNYATGQLYCYSGDKCVRFYLLHELTMREIINIDKYVPLCFWIMIMF